MRRRVVVTGVGCVTPLGTTVADLWQNLLDSKSGVGRTTLFDASSFPTNIAAEVRDWSIADVGEDPAAWEDRSRHTCFAAGAAKQAVEDSGVLGTVEPVRFGVYLGAGEGQQDFMRFSKMMTAAVNSSDNEGDLSLKGIHRNRHGIARSLQPNSNKSPTCPSGYLAGMFNAQGPNVNCLTACAASSQAVGEATEIIRRGEADVMLSGGAHSMIHPFGVTGFNLTDCVERAQ